MSFRTGAAAVVLAVLAVALPALGADSTVVLQVVPRGNGTVTSSVADRTTGATSCAKNQEPGACDWTFTKGAAVVLHAQPATGSTFAGWSTQECPGTGDCKPTLDDDASVVALFSKLTLSVETSGAVTGDVVTSNPAGISCPATCTASFDAKSTVVLTVKTAPGSTVTSFPYGCTSVSGNDCTVTMLDEPQSVGVKLNGAQGPVQADVVKVTVTVRKAGDGSGKVSAGSGLDCGGTCFAAFPYGTLARFSASPDTGSHFGGWGGLCASDSDLRCSLPVGAITLVRPSFLKDAPPPPLAVRFVGRSLTGGRLVMRFTSTVAVTGTATLFLEGKQVKSTPISLRAGANALGFRLPPRGRHARLVLVLQGKTFSYRVVVPR